MNETMTDRELDAYLAEHLFGWADVDAHYESRRWEFTDPPYEPVTEGRGREPVEADPDIKWKQPAHRLHFTTFPCYSSTGEGMLKVIEAMRERGYDCLTWRWQHQDCSALFAHPHDLDRHFLRGTRADTRPRAVAEAARAALEAEG